VSDDKRADRPATFREVFASREYRALYVASTASWVGDYLAKAAVTALVYARTESVTATAATFAISFLPWVAGGPVLAALAERYPNRTVMIISDLGRMVLIALITIPRMPVPAMLVLLFGTAMLNPPFDASRSAMLPRLLAGDRYVVGMSLQISSNQAAQLLGYLAGSVLAAFSPRLALLIDAATFALSAFMIGLWVHHRPAVLPPERRTHLLRETADGFRVVFGSPALRAIALVVFVSHLFTSPPEGLAAAWAGQLEHDPVKRGVAQGLIMVGTPLGLLIGGLVVARLVPPDRRQRLIRPFSVLAPLALVPTVFNPNAVVVALLAVLCGVAVAGMLPASNGLFVQALHREYRARAFGVMQAGLQIVQGLGVLITGALAARFALPTVVGTWSMLGVVLMLAVASLWPSRGEFAEAIGRAQAANAAAEAAEAAGPVEGGGRHAAPDQVPSPRVRTAESL
jgi:MFS family permease